MFRDEFDYFTKDDKAIRIGMRLFWKGNPEGVVVKCFYHGDPIYTVDGIDEWIPTDLKLFADKESMEIYYEERSL